MCTESYHDWYSDCAFVLCFFFFFKQKTAYEMRISDWSSDVCSSDLCCNGVLAQGTVEEEEPRIIFGELSEIVADGIAIVDRHPQHAGLDYSVLAVGHHAVVRREKSYRTVQREVSPPKPQGDADQEITHLPIGQRAIAFADRNRVGSGRRWSVSEDL